jgi:hypothetical protein
MIKLGVVRGISYGLFAKPDDFVPAARALGASLIRAYVYWAQVEPEPGRYEWETVDALLAQLDGDEEVWLTVCSSSQWATREATDFLPPSPAKDLDAYAEFVRRLVGHCRGRIRYWQCDNEPSNTGLLWAGTAPEYVTQLRAMHTAVRAADPAARVVLGGCGYDVLSGEAPARRFFDHVVDAGRDAFDLFDLHLYGAPERIGEYVDYARTLMTSHGYQKPIVAGEHGGPVLFEFPELEPIMEQVFLAAFAGARATQSTGELADRAGQDTPERRAMAALYARAAELPPQLRMLMDGCPPELERKRHRINCRQLVVRTVLALACGIRRIAYWNLAPEVPGWHDPYQMMGLLFGKLPLLESLDAARPAAGTFALLAGRLRGVTAVHRIPSEVQAYRCERAGRPPVLIVWDQRDWFAGEDGPDVRVVLPWAEPVSSVVDAFGEPRPVTVRDGRLEFDLSATPIIFSPDR